MQHVRRYGDEQADAIGCGGDAGGLEKALGRRGAIGGQVHRRIWICQCALGDGAVSPITSGIQYFRDEFMQHQKEGGCPFDQAASTLWSES